MKIIIVPIFVLVAAYTQAQSKKELRAQIEALKVDTTRLFEENRELKEVLESKESQLEYKTQKVELCENMRENTEGKMKNEIEQLSIILERNLDNSSNYEERQEVVFFGKKNEFHGYNVDEGIGFGPEWYIAIPFGVDRKLTNTVDLSRFSYSYATTVYFKVEINNSGKIIRLWCNESKSEIKNRTLLRLIGLEIQKQAKYSEAENSGFPAGSSRLVEFSMVIWPPEQ